MIEFYQQLDPLLKGLWLIALPVSVIFVIQTILAFAGMDAADGTSADFEGDLADGESVSQIFSLRNLINFLLGFSWGGISFYTTISSPVALIAMAIAIGVVFTLFFFLIIRQFQKLAEDNSFRLNDCLNLTAEVYIPISEAKTGKGKVQVSVKGSIHELDAVTAGERLKTGTLVRIVAIEQNSILIVEKI